MPPPSTQYTSRAGNANYDLATLSDDEDAGSNASQSTWSSSSNPDATVLGYSDGLMPKAAPELQDWKVSRIGGDPVFPPFSTPPSPSSALCASCSQRMPLLTQIYCPLDSSALERVVYVFACSSKACRGKAGCVRAWRASQLWVEEEEQEEVVVVEEEKKEQGNVQLGSLIFGGPTTSGGGATSTTSANPFAPSSSNPFATPSAANSNPFAMASSSSNPFAPSAPANPFAPASPSPFASAPSPPPPAPKPSTPPPPPKSEPEPLTWPTLATSYTPHWLTTAYEPPAPSSKSKSAAAAMAALSISSSTTSALDDRPKHKEGKGAGGRTKKGSGGGAGRAGGGGAGGEEAGWGKEGYEVQQVKGVDDVFLRFQERVDRDGLQVVRYHHASPPLPYSSHSLPYRTLFPTPSHDPSAPGIFTPSRIPSCLNCPLPSTFEYQLMPNLVALLNRDAAKRDQEGKSKGKSVMEQDGLDFATVWVFACVGECVGEAEEAWREERVLVEWEEASA